MWGPEDSTRAWILSSHHVDSRDQTHILSYGAKKFLSMESSRQLSFVTVCLCVCVCAEREWGDHSGLKCNLPNVGITEVQHHIQRSALQ